MTTILSNHTVGRRDRFSWLLSTIGILTFLSCSANAQPESKPADPLPSNFSLPGETSPTVEINEPLITSEKLTHFQRTQSNYNKALRDGTIDAQSRKLIEEGIAARMLAVTLKEQRANLTALRTTVLRDIKTHAGRNELTPRLKRKFREMVLDEVLKNARLLLKNNQTARLFAMTVVNELNIVEEDRRTQTPAEPYEPALALMREVVNDPEQDAAVKIIALQGIKRFLENPQLKLARNDLLQTAEDLAKELKDPTTHYWLQQNLIRALRATQIDVNRANQPFIVQGLAEVMNDPKRHPLVRCDAAYTIPRVPLANTVNLSLISWQIAKLTQEMATEYNKNPNHFWWQSAFFRLYGAYQPLQKGANNALIPIAATPAMVAHQPNVVAAYQQALPVMKAVFENKGGVKLDQADIAPLGEWLKANEPSESSVYDGGPPLTQNDSTNATSSVNTTGP